MLLTKDDYEQPKVIRFIQHIKAKEKKQNKIDSIFDQNGTLGMSNKTSS